MLTNLQKWGNSHGVRIPSGFMKTLGWKRNEKLLIEMNRDAIVLRKSYQRRRVSLTELFRNFGEETTAEKAGVGKILHFDEAVTFAPDCRSRTAVVIGNPLLQEKTGRTFLCPIVSDREAYPLHIALDERNKAQGMILCEYLQSVGLREGSYQITETLPRDLLLRIVDMTAAELDSGEEESE
ncbi:MAG: AbrB/MazE/SpoVT family DNA-binding domain-containing protein [Eubacteriales bacterium]|nr:AbrB/MazE/SpoVT family DNA-binding domain-containing protein [Eubacteriales bacterium]